jgi:hypothetical protein
LDERFITGSDFRVDGGVIAALAGDVCGLEVLAHGRV